MSTATPVFTVQFAELTDALKTVAPAVAKRPRVAAVSGVLLESDGRDMIVTSNNFHESIVARVPDAVGVPGRLLVPHLEVTRTLKALVRGMSKPNAESTPVTIRAHGTDEPVTVHVGESAIPVDTLSLAQFPERPDVPATGVTLPGGEFTSEARRVLRACGRDDTLPMTYGVKIAPAPDGGVTLAATDRYRIAVGHVSALTSGESPTETLVGGPMLERVLPVLTGDAVRLGTGPDPLGDVVTLSTDRVAVILRVHEGTSLDHRAYLPDQTATTVQVDRRELRTQIERSAGVLAAKENPRGLVTVTVTPDGLTTAPHVTNGHGHLRMPALRAHTAGERSIRVHISSVYLREAVDSFDTSTLTLHLQSWDRPVLVTAYPDGPTDPFAFKHLLMPVRDPD